MKMRFFVIIAFLAYSCDELEPAGSPEGSIPPTLTPATGPAILGMNTVIGSNSFEDTYVALQESLAANANIEIVAEVDHAANAAGVGTTLDPSKIIFFGNPSLGTPLMQQNQLAGLDLPQKILVYQPAADTVYLPTTTPNT